MVPFIVLQILTEFNKTCYYNVMFKEIGMILINIKVVIVYGSKCKKYKQYNK